ncbi:hypothetical protein EXIGLDRAFT_747235 [Exidia glandulosa HHB12029]|uniref:Uncharacterized protein n=1 Tax=Exidia glandulosa HHB12029 TaxID=1314781 RepID=A0A166B248_EXIGL|nr:hypothetical protein EXIGLDRAFT_747235 [Exidia glandulosa HHB12029]
MFTTKLTTLLALPLFAAAYINDVQQFSGTYTATPTTSTFPVTFNTASTKVEFMDLSVSFGIAARDDHADNTTLGAPLNNVDLIALNHANTGPGSFTVDVPISASDLYAGAGSYVLTAAVLRGTGMSGVLTFRADSFSIPFNATIADSDA